MDARVKVLNDAPVRTPADYVLYWAQMNRRVESNHALEYAAARANALQLPLLVYEGLTCTYPYASDRFHTFLLEGIPETSRRLAKRRIGYVFHLRRRRGAGGAGGHRRLSRFHPSRAQSKRAGENRRAVCRGGLELRRAHAAV
jgi:hypothetical protein